MDGDQAWEALVGETQAFHEEQQLRGAARVLDHMVELLPAQDVDVTLAKERIWGDRDQCQTVDTPRRGQWGRVTDGGQDGRVTCPPGEERKAQAENATRGAVAWSSCQHYCVLPTWH